MATSLRMATSVQRWSSSGRGRATISQVSSRCWPSAHEVVLPRRPQGRERLGLGPAIAGDQPHAASAARPQRQRLGAARVLQDSKRLAPEYVRMPRELEERYRGVEVIQASRCEPESPTFQDCRLAVAAQLSESLHRAAFLDLSRDLEGLCQDAPSASRSCHSPTQ